MAGVTWKMAVLMAVLVIFAVLEFQIAEAQSSACSNMCSSRAYCYRRSSGISYCKCRSGYKGDGLMGTGHSGCRKCKFKVWKIIVAVIGAAIGALLLLCLCLVCVRKCLTRRKKQSPVVQKGYPQEVAYPQQAAYPQGTYETNNQKVPGPIGAV